MKIKVGQDTTGMSIDELKCGNVFRFVSSREDQVYQMSQDGDYQSLKTGITYNTDTCCPDAVVIHYPDAEIDLGVPSGEKTEEEKNKEDRWIQPPVPGL